MSLSRRSLLALASAVIAASTAISVTAQPGGDAPAPLSASAPVAASSPIAVPGSADSTHDHGTPAATSRALDDLERKYRATVGVVAIDTATGRTLSHNGDQRFPFASTNKTFIAAAVLAASAPADLGAVVHYDASDLLEYAPITSRFVDTGMTVRELLDAMLRFSDNTAANLLVERVGGPEAVQRYLRGLGDDVTNVNRLEPDLNEAAPGDPRDTTTPRQFALDLRTVLLGDALQPAPRSLLRNLMLANTTGDGTIRAGVDAAWPVADKTGTGERGVRNDIGVVYPTGRAPIVIVVMTVPEDPTAKADDALLAAATRVLVAAFGR